MKHLSTPIQVVTHQDVPERFTYRDTLYQIIRVEENWILQGNWWMAEEKRTYFRVQLRYGVAVLYLREVKNQPPVWMLESMFD
jgi:hypothetical protein